MLLGAGLGPGLGPCLLDTELETAFLELGFPIQFSKGVTMRAIFSNPAS